MNWGYKGFTLLVLALCVRSMPILIQQDSFISHELQRSVADFIKAADKAGMVPQKIFSALQISGAPVVSLYKTLLGHQNSFYRVVFDPPAFVVRTLYGDLVGTGSKKHFSAACYAERWRRDLFVCNGNAHEGAAALDWLMRQDPAVLMLCSVDWKSKNYILLAMPSRPNAGSCIITSEQNIDLDRWEFLAAHAQDSVGAQKNSATPLYDFRFEGLSVLSKAQKNRKRGGGL